jgi:hypothetical protein
MTPTDSWTRGRFTVEMLKKRGVALLSLEVKIDTPSAAGELVLHVFGTIAQFERRLVAERTYDGMTAARAKERKPGSLALDHDKLNAATAREKTASRQPRLQSKPAWAVQPSIAKSKGSSKSDVLAQDLGQILRCHPHASQISENLIHCSVATARSSHHLLPQRGRFAFRRAARQRMFHPVPDATQTNLSRFRFFRWRDPGGISTLGLSGPAVRASGVDARIA